MTTTIELLQEMPLEEFAVLVRDSEEAGWRFVRRLSDEWATGTNRFRQPGEALFAARLDGVLVGVCGLNVDPYTGNARVGRVRRLYVHSSHRRQGIGRELVVAVIQAATGVFDALRLRTENPEAAHFYEALGFRPAAGDSDCTHILTLAGKVEPAAREARGGGFCLRSGKEGG
jgi:GNAT superfamily N-acetyltransferase